MDKASAKKLFDEGYRQVSRKFRLIAKVDISIKEMKQFFIDRNYGRTNTGIPSLPIKQQMEQYRRCHSKDEVEVSEKVMAEIRALEKK